MIRKEEERKRRYIYDGTQLFVVDIDLKSQKTFPKKICGLQSRERTDSSDIDIKGKILIKADH